MIRLETKRYRLAHELAHIRRHNYLVNWAQMAIETLLFDHPAVWWISSRNREERELCCDDLAIAATQNAAGYANWRSCSDISYAWSPSFAHT
ncbi:MAG TPA: M56 family metallopeptidase [Candidatus Limnocylindrales bacterium]|nr:M56 family metallopeptidase [Candidatus Limnocylindrales bacterium]